MPASSNSQPTLFEAVRCEIAKRVVGQQEMLEQMLITILCGGHSQIEGVSGVAKWMMVRSLGECLGLRTRKLRCSPDLKIENVIGPHSDTGTSETTNSTCAGAIFSNLVLVDNIDQLAPHVHNLIQQSMQERVIEVRGKCWSMPEPFVLFATRYPSHDDETPAPEIQDDRFLFRIAAPYPPYVDEYAIAQATTELRQDEIRPVISVEELAQREREVLSSEAPAGVIHYAVRLVRATRVHEGENLDFIYEWVQRGAGPRAVQSLVLAAKARAILHGRQVATHADLRAVTMPTLRHRVITNRNAQANGIPADRVIHRLLDEIPPHIEGDDVPPKPGQSFSFHNWTPIEE